MEKEQLINLKRQLSFCRLQLESINELSDILETGIELDQIFRIFFSVLMGSLSISSCFFWDSRRDIFRKRGFLISSVELEQLKKALKKIKNRAEVGIDELQDAPLVVKICKRTKVATLINLSRKKNLIFLGLGPKKNNERLSQEELEYVRSVSRFVITAIDNHFFLKMSLEKKKIESELQIARQIQRSLLSSNLPRLENFEIAYLYEPIQEVGGDYYDFLKKRGAYLPIVVADVEGKGLSAALVAASSQAILHTLNELYLFNAAKFMAKVNNLIYELTHGEKFVTIFWCLLNDQQRKITYVNAGHCEPFLFRKGNFSKLRSGGFLAGFIPNAVYEEETIYLENGDLICIYTDGVFEVENEQGKEFGEDGLRKIIERNFHLPPGELIKTIYHEIKNFAVHKEFRDDFTVILIKAK